MNEEVTKTVTEQLRGFFVKGRSCRDYQYYSYTLKSKAKNPRCVKFLITGLDNVKLELINKDIFLLWMFGYSVYMTETDSFTIKQHTKTQLPGCAGFEILRTTSANTSSVPAHVQNRFE